MSQNSTKVLKDYHLVDTVTELASYRGIRSSLLLLNGYQYTSMISSATVDGVCVVANTGNSTKRWILDPTVVVKPQDWGAKGDGTTDDAAAFVAAFKSGRNVVIPPVATYYRIAAYSVVSAVTKLTIQASGARILCTDKTVAGWLFQSGSDISITGGEFGYTQSITANGNSNQHIMQFDNCQRVTLTNVKLDNSPEMGVAITNCLDVAITNCRITRTWRDGIYTRYSARVKYLNNYLDNIKDDAISFHDKDNLAAYATADKTILNSYGYSQSTDALIDGNIISNSYQGIASVSGSGVRIIRNTITNTVNGGITLFNFRNNDPAVIANSEITGNTITSACSTVTINGVTIANTGQATAGRGAIALISLDATSQISLSGVKRSANVTIKNNRVYSSGALGLVAYNTDVLNLSGNLFQNCVVTGNSLGGNVTEIWEVTGYIEESANNVIDTRTTVQHQRGYSFSGVTGVYKDWVVTNRTVADGLIGNSPNLTNQFTNNVATYDLPRKLGFIDTAIITDWNSYTATGIWQVAGASVAASTNVPFPFGLANAGSLRVDVSQGTVVHTYTDYLGNQAYRHLNGLGSSSWSTWVLIADASKTFVGETSSGSRSVTTGAIGGMNLKSGDYSVAPAVTGMPTAANYTLHVTHHEDSSAPGGGTWATWIAIPLITTDTAYVGGKNGDGSQKPWVALGGNAVVKPIIATTYANAQTQTAALPANTLALVSVAADESAANAGTGIAGANPQTAYVYLPTIGLLQLVTY